MMDEHLGRIVKLLFQINSADEAELDALIAGADAIKAGKSSAEITAAINEVQIRNGRATIPEPDNLISQ